MREEWNVRAIEDAHYYVAFGRRDQSIDEFFASAQEILTTFYRELKRGTPVPLATRRFLEIGCGPGRLMRPLSELCGEIHGVDVSDAMIAQARKNLAGIPHAHPHHGTGSTLEFSDNSFDFVYSYAVFQHIPSRDVVMNYLRETQRVLKPGGLARLQINGLPLTSKAYTTWEGVRIQADEIRRFARNYGLQLLALEGAQTQYMWTTLRKLAPRPLGGEIRIRRITNAFSSEPVAAVGGRFASISLWVEGLEETADLSVLDLRIEGRPAVLTYLGRAEADGIRQLNALLPEGLNPGLVEVSLGNTTHRLRLIPKPPTVPRVMTVSDGVDLMAGTTISSGTIKLSVEEFEPLDRFRATIGEVPVNQIDTFCVDPGPPRHEINFPIPPGLSPGEHTVRIWLGQRQIANLIVTLL